MDFLSLVYFLCGQLKDLDYEKYYPSYEYFLKNVLLKLTTYLMEEIKPVRTYNIIIVSHSHFFKTIFGIKLNNCQYILERNALYNYKGIRINIYIYNSIQRQ